ncbi:radical SAM protein [Candidatus Pseudothioglobus singularis]|jgi:organic radical activating enzyme|uniref:Radical SAM core domain-containing protein n=1 Tax=Candidatus Pseudothioglobus singularis PS1 TaxID=1125411 RepID=A0A0M4M4H2_9GAMM|nr:radical SAM protein [Candidatus Pseudothioglobus singularis]ALE02767.1 hypothetical protein W908_07000 [Candidatus Pseudothioglobus singularis PS1]
MNNVINYDSIAQLKESLEKEEDVYIYGFGISGRWLAANIDIPIQNFIDTDTKKSGRESTGISCITLDEAKEKLTKNSVIIISVIDIQDVLPNVENLNIKKWLALGLFLNNHPVHINPTDESEDFVKYSLQAVEKCHKSYLVTQSLYLRSVDVVITEKCSLKCKDCSNLMQYYEAPVDISFEEIKADFDELTSKVEYIYEIRLIGGEPFMNKDIYRIMDYFNNNNKITKQVVYSNATIPLKEEFVNILKHPKLVFTLTDYRKVTKGAIERNTAKVHEALKRLEVPHRLHDPENWTDSGVLQDFKRDVPEMKEMFLDCCARNLITLTDNKLYRCPFAANADRLQGMPDDKRNYVSVNASTNDIKKYINDIEFIPACNFCKGRSYSAPEIESAIQTSKPIPYEKYINVPIEIL